MGKELETLTISKGTLIHINGIPFELSKDTKVMGLQSNLDLVLKWSNQFCSSAFFSQSEHSLLSPLQAASAEVPVASLITSSLSFESMQDDK